MAILVVDQIFGPYFTITAAEAAAAPFDIIRVNSGTYNENVVVNTSDIKFIANAPSIVLDGTSLGGTGFTLNTLNTVINGFTIQNFDVGISISTGSSGNTIIYNRIQFILTSYGIEIYGNSNIINANSISCSSSHVVYMLNCTNNKIRNNIISVLATPNFSGIYPNYTTLSTINYNQITITGGSNGILINQSAGDLVRDNFLT